MWSRKWSRVAVALATAFVCCSGHPRSSSLHAGSCQRAFDARDWAQVIESCRRSGWSAHAKLGEAWVALGKRDHERALVIADALVGTEVGADAAYLAGNIRAERSRSAEEEEAGRALLLRALAGYQAAGRHADASLAAGYLSRVPRPESRFDDALFMARLAVAEAVRGGNARLQGRAEQTLAEVYDSLGMADAARDSFYRAAALFSMWPEEQAFNYFNHALFLLDLGEPPELRRALSYLDAASEQVVRAAATKPSEWLEFLAVAIHLNRGDALSQLGQLDAADRELALVQENKRTRSKLRLVKGYVAAGREDLAAAVRFFSEANEDSLERDYRWRVSVEIARLHRRAGHTKDAEQAYRAAIDTIEQLRADAAAVELRPWVLARRALPYHELLALLVEQGRSLDALAVAESLHARSWLDTVSGGGPDGVKTEAQALSGARIQRRLAALAVRAAEGSELLASVGEREALVFVTAGKTTWRAHIVRGQVRFQQLPAGASAAVDAYHANPNDPSAAERAAAALIPDDLQRGEQPIYIVASGPLRDTMFAGLRRGGRYLIEDRPISYLPGLAALRCASGPWNDHQIFIGDSRGDLPAAAREVALRAAAARTQPSVGVAATRDAVLLARRANLLHVAVHGSATALGGALVLSDGELTAAEVLDLDIGPRLAMLTGCATAIGLDDELWGALPSAFLAAGSRHVVATFRAVEDRPAARVTEAYYAQASLASPIHRLAAAQRELIGVLPVAAWASFGAWGNAECTP